MMEMAILSRQAYDPGGAGEASETTGAAGEPRLR